MKKRHQKSREEVVQALREQKKNESLINGMKVDQTITFMALTELYDCEPESIQEFYDKYRYYLNLYYEGELTNDIISTKIDELKADFGIDILEPVTIKDERNG